MTHFNCRPSLRAASLGLVFAIVSGCSQENPEVTVDEAPPTNLQMPEETIRSESDHRLNILLILADDMGYTDLGVFGGEIQTPNIDALAEIGVKLTQFYATPSCAPTRATLMSGLDTHQSGLGNMAEWMRDNQRGHPGYEGVLNDRVVSLASLLKDAGYHTYMAGKWHLGHEAHQGPSERGFEKSFALLNGSAMHYDIRRPNMETPTASYREDGVRLTELPSEFKYSTDFYTDYLIRNIDANIEDDKPFFAWAAYTSPHWPLQVPTEYSDKYAGRYDDGYEVLRAERLARLKELGLMPEGVELPPLPDGITPWEDLTNEQQAIDAREMEIYAGMVDNLDVNVGRLIAHLQAIGEYENTLIFFMSDNGADAGDVLRRKSFVEYAEQFDNNLETMGGPDSFVDYGREWAHASTSPFKLWKTFATEGGMRVPAIISQAGAPASGGISGQLLSAKDVMPTFLAVAETTHPGTMYEGRAVSPIEGASMLPLLDEATAAIHNDDHQFAFEIIGRSALRRGDWKLARIDKPFGSGEWELHDIAMDPGELNDLSTEYPAVMSGMLDAWAVYEQEMNIVYPDTPGLD